MDYPPNRWPYSPRIAGQCASLRIEWAAITSGCVPFRDALLITINGIAAGLRNSA